MKLGLIGNPLGHSWSPAIHSLLIGADYQLWPLEEDQLAGFLKKRDFDGLNVTIPYKQAVMPYLDEIDEAAKMIGAVNTIVNRNGKLKGYNTDYYGFMATLRSAGFDVKGKKVAILGSGGASKAVRVAITELGGNPLIVSRKPQKEQISYEELKALQPSYIINATPVGMYPKMDTMPIDPADYSSLEGIGDVIANPLRTRLVIKAQMKGLKTFGGLEMLVRQAFKADELFLDQKLDESLNDKCLQQLIRERRNLVLIGMPTAGKSTLAALLAARTGKKLVETDQQIVEEIGMPITEYFRLHGEEAFRDKESQQAGELAGKTGLVISCGGGIIKREENMLNLAQNGLIIWIDRDLELLETSDSRPLSNAPWKLKELYEERKPLYEKYSDIRIANNGSLEETLEKLLEGEKNL